MPFLASAVGVFSVVVAIFAGLNVGRINSIRSALDISQQTVTALEEARKADNDSCERRLATMEAKVTVLESSLSALSNTTVEAVTRMVTEAIVKELAVYGPVLQAGQAELLNAIHDVGGQIGAQRRVREQRKENP